MRLKSVAGVTPTKRGSILGRSLNRAVASTIALLVLGSALVACSSNGEGDGAAEADEPAKASFVDFTYKDYSTKIPLDPKRVVTLDDRVSLDFALTVGYPVVGYLAPQRDNSYFWDSIPKDAKKFVTWPPTEKVLALGPDLIVVNSDLFEYYTEEGILSTDLGVPILVIDAPADSANWRDSLVTAGELIQREDSVETALSEFDAKLAGFRENVLPAMDGQRLGIAWLGDGQFMVLSRTIGYAVAKEAGVDLIGSQPDEQKYLEVVSSELLSEALTDADILMAQNIDNEYGVLKDAEIFKRLPAVANDNTVPLNTDFGSTGLVFVASHFLDDLTAAIEGATS